MPREKTGRYVRIGIAAVFVFALDYLSKAWILENLPEHKTIPVIPGFFDIVRARNYGAAFGFLNRQDIEWQFWLFLLATLVAVAVIFLLARQPGRQPATLFWGLGLILGGALGNLLDRIRFRSVVDFLDFYWGEWHWPAFNVADMGICMGAFLVCLAMWRKPRVAA